MEIGSGLKIRYDGPDHHWHVATVYGQREENEPLACCHGYASANARLIASAPELLRQRDELLEVVTEAYKWLDRCGEKAAGNYLTQSTVGQ